MGQKINAIGLRLGVNRNWDSKWFAEKEYTSSIHKDLITTEFLTRVYEKKGILVSRIIIERALGKLDVTVYLYVPTEGLSKEIKQEYNLQRTLVAINDVDVNLKIFDALKLLKEQMQVVHGISLQLPAYRSRKYFYEGLQVIGVSMMTRSALLLSKYCANQIEKDFRHNQFIDYIKKTIPFFLDILPEVKGIRIQFKGRLNGSDRSKIQWFKYGQIPFHTLKESIDYGYAPAFTPYGVCSIKVWICFIPLNKESIN
jgi:small subunit ribosomal protein S3